MPVRLEDLLAATGGGQAGNLTSILTGGAGMAPPAVASPQIPLDPTREAQIQSLISALGEPAPTPDYPVQPQSTLAQKILAGISDAASTYASGLNPSIRPLGVLPGLIRQDEASRYNAAENTRAKAGAAYEGRQRQNEARLRELMGERQKAEANQATLEERQFTLQRDAAHAADEERLARTRGEYDSMNAMLDRQSREKIAGMESRTRLAVAAGEDKAAQRQIDREQRVAKATAKKAVIGLARNIGQELSTKSPDQITQDLMLDLEPLDLNEESMREIAKLYDDNTREPFMRWRLLNMGPQQEQPGLGASAIGQFVPGGAPVVQGLAAPIGSAAGAVLDLIGPRKRQKPTR